MTLLNRLSESDRTHGSGTACVMRPVFSLLQGVSLVHGSMLAVSKSSFAILSATAQLTRHECQTLSERCTHLVSRDIEDHAVFAVFPNDEPFQTKAGYEYIRVGFDSRIYQVSVLRFLAASLVDTFRMVQVILYV